MVTRRGDMRVVVGTSEAGSARVGVNYKLALITPFAFNGGYTRITLRLAHHLSSAAKSCLSMCITNSCKGDIGHVAAGHSLKLPSVSTHCLPLAKGHTGKSLVRSALATR